MITIDEIKDLPDSIKNEILDYAEYLAKKYDVKQNRQQNKKWTDVSARGVSKNETASETLVKMREEEKW